MSATVHRTSVAVPGLGIDRYDVTEGREEPAIASLLTLDQPDSEKSAMYASEEVIGNGAFGVVFRATEIETGEIVAIKKALQDRKFKNRELDVMRELMSEPHSNVCGLKNFFYSQGADASEEFLNLVLEFVPGTIGDVISHYYTTMPPILIKLYIYQMARSLHHIHRKGLCHRDIKPGNVLVCPKTHVLKLCDFGSVKYIKKGEPNVSYICHRHYRAPELIFGSSHYGSEIDIWSVGCIASECMLGKCLFPGDSGVDQLVEIIKVLGTPTPEQIATMNDTYTEFKFPIVKGCKWQKVFKSKTSPEFIDLIEKTLRYEPKKRMKPLECCGHEYLDELRDPNTVLPDGAPMPPLFDFTQWELNESPDILKKLIPEHLEGNF